MIRVAIVEDNLAEYQTLADFLTRYSQEFAVEFEATHFGTADLFLDDNINQFDLVFMDIQMPGTDGMTAAQRMRQINPYIVLVFVTNMAHLAIHGYEVDAMDFVVKPISYFNFSMKMTKAVKYVKKNDIHTVQIKTDQGISLLHTTDIHYIEVLDHHLLYYTDKGKVDICGSLSKVEAELRPYGFSRCSSSYLVNMRYIESVSGNKVTVDGRELPLTRTKKDEFMNDFLNYLKAGDAK